MLDFRVETFLCVCRHMNFTKAAGELAITQPGVTQHIHFLERYYGCKLFFHKGKSLFLTPAGEELRSALLSMKHDEVHLKNQVSGIAQEQRPLVFGATLTIGEYFVAPHLTGYMTRNPAAVLSMMVSNTRELLSALDEGALDFVLLEGYFPQKEYESKLLSVEDYIAVAAVDYEVQIGHLTDLLGHRLLLREEGSGTREILVHYLMEQGYSLDDFEVGAQISNIHALKHMAASGCGITFLYRIAATEDLKRGKLKEILLPGGPITHEFRFVWRKNSIYKEYYEKICGELFLCDPSRLIRRNVVQ